MNETQILQAMCRNICKLNSSCEAGNNAIFRVVRCIFPPCCNCGDSKSWDWI